MSFDPIALSGRNHLNTLSLYAESDGMLWIAYQTPTRIWIECPRRNHKLGWLDEGERHVEILGVIDGTPVFTVVKPDEACTGQKEQTSRLYYGLAFVDDVTTANVYERSVLYAQQTRHGYHLFVWVPVVEYTSRVTGQIPRERCLYLRTFTFVEGRIVYLTKADDLTTDVVGDLDGETWNMSAKNCRAPRAVREWFDRHAQTVKLRQRLRVELGLDCVSNLFHTEDGLRYWSNRGNIIECLPVPH